MKHQIWGTHGPVSRQTKPCQKYSKVRSGTGLCNRGRLLHSTFAGDLKCSHCQWEICRYFEILVNSSFVSILSRHVCQNVTVSQCNQAAVGGSACRERKRKGYWLAKDKKGRTWDFSWPRPGKEWRSSAMFTQLTLMYQKKPQDWLDMFHAAAETSGSNFGHTAQDAWCEDMRSIEAPRITSPNRITTRAFGSVHPRLVPNLYIPKTKIHPAETPLKQYWNPLEPLTLISHVSSFCISISFPFSFRRAPAVMIQFCMESKCADVANVLGPKSFKT